MTHVRTIFSSSAYGVPSSLRRVNVHKSNEARVGADSVSTSMLGSFFDKLTGRLIPVFALGSLGAIFGGTLWGWKGLATGAGIGALAGYGITRLPGAELAPSSAWIDDSRYKDARGNIWTVKMIGGANQTSSTAYPDKTISSAVSDDVKDQKVGLTAQINAYVANAPERGA